VIKGVDGNRLVRRVRTRHERVLISNCHQAVAIADADEASPKPRALCAFTVHVYLRAVVSAVTLIGLAAPVADFVTPPLLDVQVAVYCGAVSGLPFACAAVSAVNVTLRTPGDVLRIVGVAGGAGDPTITGSDAADANPVPRALCALTVQV
jgi:hypothetical protein